MTTYLRKPRNPFLSYDIREVNRPTYTQIFIYFPLEFATGFLIKVAEFIFIFTTVFRK